MAKEKKKDVSKGRIAKRDFTLCRNQDFFKIKKGDDLDDLGVPEIYDQNLKTEKVL